MNASDFTHLREASWHRRLTPEEERQLRVWAETHPDAAAEIENDAALNAALATLPDAPVPSNFTALVLREVDRGSARAEATTALGAWWRQLRPAWLPRAAVALAAVLLLGVGWRQYQIFRQQQIAHNLARLSFAAASVPEPQVFADFDAIRRLNPAPSATDEALFTVLNQ